MHSNKYRALYVRHNYNVQEMEYVVKKYEKCSGSGHSGEDKEIKAEIGR